MPETTSVDLTVASGAAYVALRDHAVGCLHCLGEVVLTLVDWRVRGDLGFDPELCPVGEGLMARLEATLAVLVARPGGATH